jgi:DNA-binding transcriptional LysR family regulator
VLRRVAEAVQTVKAASRGEKGELHVGYAPSLTTKLLPQALESFQEANPGVRVVLHDFSTEEMLNGLREGELQMALLKHPPDKSLRGLTFEELDHFAVCVATNRTHRFARARQVGLRHFAGERLIGYPRAGYPEYHAWPASLFVPLASPAIAEEHESSLSLIAAVEAGCGIALIAQGLESMAGSRLKIRALNPAPAPVVVGVAYRKGRLRQSPGNFLRHCDAQDRHSGVNAVGGNRSGKGRFPGGRAARNDWIGVADVQGRL